MTDAAVEEIETTAPADDAPSVDAVIVNWNGGAATLAAVRSAAAFGARPIVVDNGSTDDSVGLLRREPDVTILEMGFNSGFARACNEGVAAGTGEYVFLLNPDASIVGGERRDIVSAFGSDPEVGIVGPRILDSSNRPTPSVRRFPRTVDLFLYQLKLHRWAARIAPLRRYFMVGFDDSRPARVDQVIGAALIARRSTWELVGGMDEGFFLLFEDVDFSRRLADRGWGSLHWPDLVVRHAGHASFRRIGHLRLQWLWNRSLLRYARKHLGAPAVGCLALSVPISLVLSTILDLTRQPMRGEPTSSDST